MFNRCVPVDIGCYAEFAQALVTFISDNNVFRRVIAGVMASKEIIMGLCVLALGMSYTYIWFIVMYGGCFQRTMVFFSNELSKLKLLFPVAPTALFLTMRIKLEGSFRNGKIFLFLKQQEMP